MKLKLFVTVLFTLCMGIIALAETKDEASEFILRCAQAVDSKGDITAYIYDAAKKTDINELTSERAKLLIQKGQYGKLQDILGQIDDNRISCQFNIDAGSCYLCMLGRAKVYLFKSQDKGWRVLFCERLSELPYRPATIILWNGAEINGELVGFENRVFSILQNGGKLAQVQEKDVKKVILEEGNRDSRKFRLIVTVSLPGYTEDTNLTPDVAVLTGNGVTIDSSKVLLSGECRVKPGQYDLIVKHNGYIDNRSRINISSGKDECVTKITLIPTLRKVEFKIDYDVRPSSEAKLEKTLVSCDNPEKKIEVTGDSCTVIPGVYIIEIKQEGYLSTMDKINIMPSNKSFIINRFLQSDKGKAQSDKGSHADKKTNVKIVVTTDWPPDEIIPEVIEISGKDNSWEELTGAGLLPGRYELIIRQAGFYPTKSLIEIPKTDQVFEIHQKLIGKPVTLRINISHDVLPPTDLSKPKVSLNDKVIQNGDSVKPGIYTLNITEDGYEQVFEKLSILPREKPFTIDYMLLASPRTMNITVTYDVALAEPSVQPCVMIADFKNPAFSRLIKQGVKIKPGKYMIKITQSGFKEEITKEIEIPVGVFPYEIKERLSANPRPLCFTGVSDTGEAVTPWTLKINGDRESEWNVKFKPGIPLEISILYKDYQTVNTKIVIPPGEGAFTVTLPTLVRLKVLELSLRRMSIDDIYYEYSFSVKGEPVEEHLVVCEKAPSKLYYTLKVNPNTDEITVHHGYRYSNVNVTELHKIQIPGNISVPKLIEHLEKLKHDPLKMLKALEFLLSNSKDREQILKSHDLDNLVKFIEKFDVFQELEAKKKEILDKMR